MATATRARVGPHLGLSSHWSMVGFIVARKVTTCHWKGHQARSGCQSLQLSGQVKARIKVVVDSPSRQQTTMRHSKSMALINESGGWRWQPLETSLVAAAIVKAQCITGSSVGHWRCDWKLRPWMDTIGARGVHDAPLGCHSNEPGPCAAVMRLGRAEASLACSPVSGERRTGGSGIAALSSAFPMTPRCGIFLAAIGSVSFATIVQAPETLN